ncbi:hypothetical protein CF335_g7424 [Tilletia laevis]|nr:hypothetical protein CF335_g7424 [Tilletia laevis]
MPGGVSSAPPLLAFGHHAYDASLRPGAPRPLPSAPTPTYTSSTPADEAHARPAPGLLLALRADIFDLLHAFAHGERTYAGFVQLWEKSGWARVWFVFGEGRRERIGGIALVAALFSEHFTPLLQFLKSHPQHSHVKTPANDKGKARDLSHTNSPIRALVLYALGALFALYTIHAAPIIEEDDDDENKEESAAGGGGGRGCLGLLPAPTWAEVNLTPIWRARKRRRENQEASSTSTSTPTPPQPRTRQTQTRSGGPPAPKRRSNWRPPKPLTDPDDIAAAVLSEQRRLEGLSGTIPVHPDEGRVLIAREVYERVVLKMPELLVEWVGEAEVREEDGIGLVDEVVFVLRALCLHERKETGTAAFTHTHTQQTGGVFRILARPPPSRATMSTGVGSDHQAAQHFFGSLWHSSSRFAERVSEAPTSLGGYLVVKIGEMRTFHLALSRADALRLAVAHRIGGFGPIATSFLRERAREHLFRAPPSYDGDGGTEEEREGMIRLAKGEFDVIGMPELSVDRGLLVAAEAKAVDAIGSGMRDENPSVAAAAIVDGGKERGTAFSPNAVEFAKMFSFGTNLGQHQPQEEGGQGSPTDARFVRVPDSCLSEAQPYVERVLGARARGALSVSDAMMEMEGVRFESSGDEDGRDEDVEEDVEVAVEVEGEDMEEEEEEAGRLEGEAAPTPASMPGMLALPGLGQFSTSASSGSDPNQPRKKRKYNSKKRKEQAGHTQGPARPTVGLDELERELEGVLVEARRRTVKALRV